MAEPQAQEEGKLWHVVVLGLMLTGPYWYGQLNKLWQETGESSFTEFQLETLMYPCMSRYENELVDMRNNAIPGLDTADNMRLEYRMEPTDRELELARTQCCETAGYGDRVCRDQLNAKMKVWLKRQFEARWRINPDVTKEQLARKIAQKFGQ